MSLASLKVRIGNWVIRNLAGGTFPPMQYDLLMKTWRGDFPGFYVFISDEGDDPLGRAVQAVKVETKTDLPGRPVYRRKAVESQKDKRTGAVVSTTVRVVQLKKMPEKEDMSVEIESPE